MTPAEATCVEVAPGSALAARPRLFGALERLLPVRFVAEGSGGAEGCAGVVRFGGAGPEVAARPAFVVCGTERDGGAPRPVTLATAGGVDRRLRGAVLLDRLGGPPLAVAGRDEVLAVDADGAAVWVRTPGEASVDRVASTLPELAGETVLYGLLSGHAIAAVGLLQFLRSLTAGRRPQPARQRATIVFDDPNLRWRSYGFINYAELLRHADAHGYHAAMAMIPIDAGRAHPGALRLFAQRPDRLSLNVHGNDHNGSELLTPRDDAGALALAAQALRRVARFERRTGLAVDRVMMPPHGRCSPSMSRALGAVGFDGLSAIHPLPWTNEWRTGPALTGMRPADFVGGCPVIPRMSLASSPADIALRAFLEHPLVLYGHHQDVASGLDLLAEVAGVVNGLGDVEWTSAGAIAQGNAWVEVAGETARIHPFSRRLRFAVPEGVRSVTVLEPEDAVGDRVLTGWSARGGEVKGFGAPAEVKAGTPLDLRLHGISDIDATTLRPPTWQPWPRLRRVVTEARDRAAPLRA